MSAKYDSTRYDDAAAAYEKASKQYSGEEGLNRANAQGSITASIAGRQAAKDAIAAGRTAGLSKSQAALGGMAAASQASANNFQSGVNTALQNNQNAIQAQQQLMSGSQHIDDQKYDAKKANQDAWMQGLSTAADAASKIISPIQLGGK